MDVISHSTWLLKPYSLSIHAQHQNGVPKGEESKSREFFLSGVSVKRDESE